MAQPNGQGGIDYPDGGFSSGSGVYPVSGDLAELAARLGSVVTFNREGNVLFIETFEGGLGAWRVSEYGTGADVIISSSAYRSSGYSVKLIPGSDGSRAAKIDRTFPYPVLGNYGAEVSFYPHADIEYVDLVLARVDGTDEHQFYLRCDLVAQKLQIKDEDGNFTDIATGVNLLSGWIGFHTVKLVADLSGDTFLRLILNETEYDLSAYPAYVFANASGPHMRVDLKAWGEAGRNDHVYFDDLILTQNEPTH